ncbi:MAG: sigma 54-interacting transcriptional regulator [bacterium]
MPNGSFQPGQLISDRYQVLERLGGGECTDVFRVKDIVGGRVLALKALASGAPREAETRLTREFFYLSRFSHPGIIAVHDYSSTPDHRPFFTMDFFPGEPMNRVFGKDCNPEQLVAVTVQVLRALDGIHAQGLIHCDLKPQNIIVRRDGEGFETKLLDFGFAEQVSLTDSTEPRGTLGYIAPEVFKGGDADARADLYSLGIVLYEILTGFGPSREKNLRNWLKMQYYTDLEPPRKANPDIPEPLEALVVALTRREPERRPRSAAAVIETLAGQQPESPAPSARKYLMAPGFVGRSAQLGCLKELLDAAGQGKAGAVCISGERGVGKSRLLAEFRFLAQLEGATILRFEPVSLGARPQSLVEALISHLRIHSISGLPAVDDWAGLVSEESKYRVFETVAQRLRELCGSGRVEHSLVLLVDDFESFDPTSLEFLRYLVFSLGKERLMVAVAGLKEKRFMDLIAEFERRDSFRHVTVPPMETADVKALTVSLLGEVTYVDKLVEWLASVTGGNPLFVIETVHALIEKGIVTQRGTRWVLGLDELAAYRAPATVTDVVRRRLEKLSDEEVEILRVGAAAAGPFTLEFLRAVLGIEEKTLFSAIGRLKALGLLRSYASEGEGYFILASKILEAVLTEGQSAAQRRDSHRRVALALELLYPERQDRLVFDLAHHYAQAGISDRAYSYSLKAGARAREFQLWEQALAFYEAALGLPAQIPSPREKAELIETVGALRELTGRFAEAIDSFTQGMSIVVADKELAAEGPLLARFLRRLGSVHQKQGRNEEALSFFNQALSMLREKGSVAHINLLNDLGWSHCVAGDFDKAEELLTQSLQLVEKLRHQKSAQYGELSARTLYYFSVLALARRDAVLALQLAERSLSIYESRGDDHNTGKVSQFIATLWLRRGSTDKAREFYERQLATQRKSGDVDFLMHSLQGLGVINLDEGAWAKAYDCFAEALGYAERMGDTATMADLNSNLGTVCDERGDWAAADSHYATALALHDRLANTRPADRAAALANLAELRSKQGEQTEAERLLDSAAGMAAGALDPFLQFHLAAARVRVNLRGEKLEAAAKSLVEAFGGARRERSGRNLAQLYTLAGELRLATGEAQRAVTDALRALRLLNNQPQSKEYAVALRLSGLANCLRDLPERGTQEVKRSIELLRDRGSQYELALSLMASVQALTKQGPGELKVDLFKVSFSFRQVPQEEINAAIADLREAQDLFRTLGARDAARHADDLMTRVTQVSATIQLKSKERGEYLKVFYQLSELISMDLEKADFAERILDLVIEVTRAERGLLFLVNDDRLVPAAQRGVDKATLEDAESISRSVLRKVKRRGELIIAGDASADSRFSASNSVMLNKIRSLLCVPLRNEEKVIGTIYLDSRINAHLFLDDDKNLLTSVSNLLAATIDRSVAFKKLQDDMTAVRADILEDAATGCFLGRSKAIQDVYRLVDRIASSDATVMLTGETGTGKGVLARLIHSKSGRRGKKFVSVDCGTLTETLLESELFGHARGSFTGAVKDKEGLFEIADGGTIFLDEISNTSLSVQAKLLQVLDDKVIRRVGETQIRRVDVRLICATNRDLDRDVREGKFRQDLFYRMNVVAIDVPPLRKRTSDIPQLAGYFVRRYAIQLNKPVTGFEDTVLKMFAAYAWPGNVREFQNVIERAVIMTQGKRIAPEDLGEQFDDLADDATAENGRRKVLEKDQVVAALKETGGNVSKAAELLQTHRRQLQRLIRRYQIDRTSLS